MANKSLKKQTVKIFSKFKCMSKSIDKKKEINKKGISPIVKARIDQMMKENMDLTPKECLLMITNGKLVSKKYLPHLFQVT